MRIRLLLIITILLLMGRAAFAQGNLLNNGDNIVGSLSATNPLGFYTFNGTAGDLVTIQVIGITPGLDPAISLNAPNQQQLAINDNDPASFGSTDARITLSLPQNGIYSVLVSSVTGAPGDFLIRLSAQQPVAGADLSQSPVTADIAPGGQTLLFTFSADPAAPTVLTVSTSTPDFAFRVIVRDSSGQIAALLTGSASVAVTLPANSGTYTAEVSAVDPAATGQIDIGLGTTQQAVVPPVATEEVTTPDDQGQPATSEVCEAGVPGDTPVNIRSGPGTDFNTIAQIEPGQRLPVAGYYTTWYLVNIPTGGQGWVRQDVIILFGPCDAVPLVDPLNLLSPAETEEVTPAVISETVTATVTATTTGTQPATLTYTPTTTSTATPTATTAQQQDQLVQATSTYTPTYTPTNTATATNTPTVPVPTAPPDANFNSPLNIPLDSTASVTDFVSYPGGDREDRVRWDITGMNPNSALSGGRARLILAVSCFGTGTQNVQFFTGGQTYSCGQTIVDREVTADSRTGQVTITAVSGTNTYVQWVLTGTATRVN